MYYRIILRDIHPNTAYANDDSERTRSCSYILELSFGVSLAPYVWFPLVRVCHKHVHARKTYILLYSLFWSRQLKIHQKNHTKHCTNNINKPLYLFWNVSLCHTNAIILLSSSGKSSLPFGFFFKITQVIRTILHCSLTRWIQFEKRYGFSFQSFVGFRFSLKICRYSFRSVTMNHCEKSLNSVGVAFPRTQVHRILLLLWWVETYRDWHGSVLFVLFPTDPYK